jgi:hypothetical protein
MMETIEILDPITKKLEATISVNGGLPEMVTTNTALKDYFLETLPELLEEGNRINGKVGRNGACFRKVYSPGEPQYWPSMRIAVGDYLMRDPKTGKVF